MGLRNDVLTTCKAVTSRVGRRIIVACFPTVNILEARSKAHTAQKDTYS